jgi:predicted Zn-dependent protease
MRRQRSGAESGIRLLIGIGIAIFSLISYLGSSSFNEVTGEQQYISMTENQEIALGLRTSSEIIQEFGGVYNDAQIQNLVDEIGRRLVNSTPLVADTPWQFEFTVLDDPNTINAFALPGGPTFITTGLLAKLETEDEIAGVFGHEIVHVLARHGAQQLAKSQLTNGLIGAVGVASGDANATQVAAVVAQLVNLRYGREDEIQSDTLGICLMVRAGYDPTGLVRLMEVLDEASGARSQPEFLSTHPDPGNRIQRIQDTIDNQETVCAGLN